VDEEYDVDGGLDLYESRKNKGTKVLPSVHIKVLVFASDRFPHDRAGH